MNRFPYLLTGSVSPSLIDKLGPIMLVKGDGIYLYDENKKQYIDAMAGAWVVNTGHGRKDIAKAISDQAKDLGFVLHEGYVSEPSTRLAKEVLNLFPSKFDSIMFASGGSESIESAIKAIKQYLWIKKDISRTKIISREHSYHGATFAAMTATGILGWKRCFGKGIPGIRHVPQPYCFRCKWNSLNGIGCKCNKECIKETIRIIENEGPETIAAFIAEPVSMSAGTAIPPLDYWYTINEVCKKNGIKMILDEIITGFGRTGEWFGFEKFGIDPDIVVIGKGLSGGYTPISGIVVSKEISETLNSVGFIHGYTYSGHPISCAGALANLKILREEKLIQTVTEKGYYLKQQLEKKLKKFPNIGEIRTCGLMGTIELVKERGSSERISNTQFGDLLKLALANAGVLTRVGVQINLGLPFIVTKDQIDELAEKIEFAIFNTTKDMI